MKKFITHVGMDTDSRGFDIAIAEGFGSNNSEVRSWGRIPGDAGGSGQAAETTTEAGAHSAALCV